jgi:hypothetical protein
MVDPGFCNGYWKCFQFVQACTKQEMRIKRYSSRNLTSIRNCLYRGGKPLEWPGRFSVILETRQAHWLGATFDPYALVSMDCLALPVALTPAPEPRGQAGHWQEQATDRGGVGWEENVEQTLWSKPAAAGERLRCGSVGTASPSAGGVPWPNMLHTMYSNRQTTRATASLPQISARELRIQSRPPTCNCHLAS